MEAANYGNLSLIPLALTLLLAFWKKDAVFALFMGCLSGVLLLGHDPAFGFSALAKEALGNEDFIWILLIQALCTNRYSPSVSTRKQESLTAKASA